MPAVLIRNNVEGDGPLTPPTHEDGRGFRYAMYTPGLSDVAFADDYDELIEVLIPGYFDLTEEEQAFQRIRYAQTAAAHVQAMIIADADGEGPEPSEAEWAVLTAPRGGTQPRADWWTSPIPLVVVTTSYKPFTDVPRPASGLSDTARAENLWWIDPSDEDSLIQSLHEVYYIRLMENQDLGI